MQINIDNLIESWFLSASPQEQLEFLRNLLDKTGTSPKPKVKAKPEPTKPPSKTHIQPIVLGKTYKSMKSAAEHYDIPYHKVQYRKDKGQSIEEIFREAYEASKKTKVMRRNSDGSIGVATVRNR